jgi:hypothetical protein
MEIQGEFLTKITQIAQILRRGIGGRDWGREGTKIG